MDKIHEITGYQILDSRGNPTIKVIVKTKKHSGFAMVPSGASTGKYEALELRDKKKPYGGKGVTHNIDIINKKISKKLHGMKVTNQEDIDLELKRLDTTENKSILGANTILAVSLAVSRVAADFKKKELYEYLAELSGNKNNPVLPVPQANVLNGGAHAGNYLKFQEFLLLPTGAKNFAHAMQMVSETYHLLKKIIDDKYGVNATNVGDEGGFAPPIRTAEEALELVNAAIAKAGYKRKIRIGMDVAASELYYNNEYDIGANFSAKGLTTYYDRLLSKFDIKSIEDPFDQDDMDAWQEFMSTVAKKRKIQIIGDDLTVSNPSRVRKAINEKLCNALLLKVNQIGTLSEALKAAKMAQEAGWEIVVSHRSGDTEDPYIADLAVGIGASQIKLGAPCRGERTAKYNRLIEIESDLKKSAYAGKKLKF
ncbi:MAG: phosphopyruvate hydratase [Nanoarchaeota archaeon]|nr:phosphopyruvate hydratase [Nanoarchaeota archaeon]MBU1321463.1 phosphopyruvate hydratase [Nanoarchaeota archaeon]MBU2442364.1 phosphopyruvate hydratase [Nanoarchaeota archaeon]